ncbi:SDR family oxidoreductase [Bacteriovoracaceae bacterium]|nr:SDR family oxidoreductase [Bacteriovoracaceae bacterium]
MDLNLKGKKALVFGSSQGIGKAVAKSLIGEGVDVCINGRTKDKVEKTAKEIGAKTYVVADLSEPGRGISATEKAITELGGLDIIIINTGGPQKNDFLDVTIEQWNTDFQSLWLSAVESLHIALPLMKEQNFGRILFVTSVAAKEPLQGLTTSNGLRAGLQGLAKSISNEYAANGITINLLLPGYTNTERIQNLNLSEEKIKSMVPAGRLAEPSELGDMATFLASPKAGYITGQSIALDGGVLHSH